MRKIRGFKLNLRLKEAQRRAKKAKLDLAAQNLGTDAELTALLSEFSKSAQASVLFDSLPAEDSALSPLPGSAFSVGLASLGPDTGLFSERNILASSAPTERREFWDIVSRCALEDATQFALALIEEEAKEEQCELSPLQYLTDPSILQAALSRLEGHKIGVTLSPKGLRPIHSLAFSLSWLARSKSRATPPR
ncbi:MAG: hypothetical protein HY551_05035 [Elusimicrobia bacterium]|nr:hypothetical protein [Elusimicrobiota bacterium]